MRPVAHQKECSLGSLDVWWVAWEVGGTLCAQLLPCPVGRNGL